MSKTAVWIFIVLIVFVLVAAAAQRHKSDRVHGGGSGPSHILHPAGRGPHTHLVELDSSGAGVSSCAEGHRHQVENTVDVGLASSGGLAEAGHQHDIGAYVVDVQG